MAGADLKPVYKRINGEWVKQNAFERVRNQWVKISTKEKVEVTDLTGTTWVFNDECFPDSATSYNINFTSNDVSFKTLLLVDAKLPDGNYIYYCRGATQTEVWNGLDFWTNESYKTITITGGTGATNTNLISWLQTNATLKYKYVQSTDTDYNPSKTYYEIINGKYCVVMTFYESSAIAGEYYERVTIN